MIISTRDLSKLPDVDALKRLMQGVATLGAILSPEWEYRFYSFNSKWSKGEQMGSMRNGQGDDLHALFNKHGCFLKGFAHECPMTPYARRPKSVWPGVLDDVPRVFAAALKEPAFTMEDTTFCVWRQYTDDRWHRGAVELPGGDDPDGSAGLLSPFEGKPQAFLARARDYYELDASDRKLTLAAVRHVYAHKPLTETFVARINPDVTLADLKADLAEIGYPNPASQR